MSTFGTTWFDAIVDRASTGHDLPGSIRVGTTRIGDSSATVVTVVPDPTARFRRARNGEMGLDEGYGLAQVITDVIAEDRGSTPRPIIVIVDVPSQAYGRVEEIAGVHQSLAASTNAIATARLGGHPVVALVVGKAISGAFLATGLQANRIVALDHDGVAVQVMSKQSAARITRRTIAELDEIARTFPPTAYDVRSFTALGAVHELVTVTQPARPTRDDVATARDALARAVASIRAGTTDLRSRLTSPGGQEQRAASVRVRRLVAESWNA